MQEAILNFFNLVYEEFIAPIVLALETFINDNSYMLGDFFKTLFNWLFNIGRDTPIEYFTDSTSVFFLYDLITYILLIIAIILIVKVIKVIFKPIFRLFSVGGDIKWRR